MTDKVDIEKVDLKSMDIVEERRERLREIFPEVFTEKNIDFDKLKSVLGDIVETGRERYGMNWAGKADCLRIIQQPSIGTLKPCREESVDFDKTENLFIEGDNLEVLKLLQKSYYGKVKMIYIDPPYNTGKDFIYPDNFSESLDTYLKYTGQVDAEGRKYSTNAETDGRFHTRWINMMYPRLYLAKNLLREDGVIFVSIDDKEVKNLRILMNEIYGEENHIATLTIINNMKGRNDKANVATCHEYLMVFAKATFESYGLPLTEEQIKTFKYKDDHGEKYALRDLRKRGRPDRREDRPNMYFAIYYNPKTNKCYLERQHKDDIEIFPKRGDGTDGRWRWGNEKVASNLDILHPKYSKKKHKWAVEHRVYLNPNLRDELGDEEADDGDQDYQRTSKSKSFWWGGDLSTDVANREFKKLFPNINPDYPKSPFLVERMLHMATKPGDVVLDFFSGYSTTAHAVLNLAEESSQGRQFLLVQLPEFCKEDSDEYRAGYKNIAEIGKERIRRVIKNTKKQKLDLGFKVFKLDSSNFRLWDGEKPEGEEAIKEQLKLHIDHIDPKSKTEDILYELLLKSGFELTTRIEKLNLAGKEVFSIEDGALLICLEEELTKEAIKTMAEKAPAMVICLDRGFKDNDQLKTNAVQIMKTKEVEFRTV